MKPVPLAGFDLAQTSFPSFPDKVGASALVMGLDGELILQQRDMTAPRAPGLIARFGGGHEPGETLLQTVVRELGEELEIEIDPAELTLLGVVKREYFNLTVPGIVGRFFWHDKAGRLTHTTEGEIIRFPTAAAALATGKLTFGTQWALEEALRQGLIPA